MDNETKIWKEYKSGLAYQSQMGFDKDFPEYEKFKEGDQWPAPTEKTKHMPRPVFNIVAMFLGSKRASVTNETLIVNYRPAEAQQEPDGVVSIATQGAKDYTDFTKSLWEEMEQDELNNELIDDAVTNGTGILHYYWDTEATGGSSKLYVGDLRGEIIDALDVFFGNPAQTKIQKQPWIIIRSRETVENVKEYARGKGVPESKVGLLTADDTYSQYESEKKAADVEKEQVTVLTKYYRGKDRSVCFDKATQSVVIVENQSLTPGATQQEQGGEEQVQSAEEPYKITMYPIVIMPWKKRKKSIFGIGDAAELITINKAYNFLKAMQLLSVQQMGWPKAIVKPGALLQPITNEPGEVIVENQADGIRFVQPNISTNQASSLAQEIFEMARTIKGVTDVSTGEMIGANMAASAIIALQNQAKTPIKEIQKRYHRTMEEAGKIFVQFYKTFYSIPRAVTVQQDEIEETRSFTGTEYSNIDFKVSVDVGSGSEFGEELAMATLDKFYNNKEITMEDYIKLAPKNVVPFAEQLKKIIEEKKMEQLQQAQQQLQQQQFTGGAMEQLPGREVMENEMLPMQ